MFTQPANSSAAFTAPIARKRNLLLNRARGRSS